MTDSGKTLHVVLILGLLLLGAWFWARPVQRPLRIGVLIPMRGPAQIYGQSKRQGIELARDQINGEGGVSGRPLEILFRDDQNDPVVAADRCRDLIYQDGAVAIIGAVSSGNTMAVQWLCERAGVPLLTACSTNPFITRMHFRYSFRCLPDDTLQAQEIAFHSLRQQQIRHMAILFDADEYGTAGARTYHTAAAALGQKVVLMQAYEPGTANFRTHLQALQAAKPDGVLIWGLARESGLIVRQIRESGWSVPIYGADGMAVRRFLDLAGRTAEGCIMTSPFHPGHRQEKAQRFVQAFQARFHTPPDSFAAFGYDSLFLIAEAIRAEQGTSAGIRRGLAGIQGFTGVTGECRFDASGNLNRPIRLARVENGTFVPLRRESDE